jgi:dCMP deaminase
MTRPPLDETFLEMARVIACRSTCDRLKVGCLITNREGTNVVSMGYNGAARGLPNGCEDASSQGACGCLHAEENALLKASYGSPLVLYTTHSPCLNCAKRILNSSVDRVVYGQSYRDTRPLTLLQERGVKITHPRVPYDYVDIHAHSTEALRQLGESLKEYHRRRPRRGETL